MAGALPTDGGSPSQNYYSSISTGQPLFGSQVPAATFEANGSRRYLGVRGADAGDTAATVVYATGRARLQTLVIPRGAAMRGAIVVVDSMRLDGPGRQCCNNIAVGISPPGKDTAAVNGITLHVWLGLSRLDGDDRELPGAYVVRIANDRMVLEVPRR